MLENTNNPESFGNFMKRTLLDPVLWYTALVMASIMYHYRSVLSVPYGLATYIGGWIVFRIFDFIQKHKLLGSVAYIALGAACLSATRLCINKGHDDYPLIWGVWFLTPQSSLEYNKWYTLAMYLLFFMFMASVIYYFTRVRYRIFMNFLIFIIPFAIYGKEYEKMPTVYIILLAVGYVLLMVMFRQLQDTSETKVVFRKNLLKPLAVYTVVFAAAAAIIPKPNIEADRSYIESLINAEQFTDKLDQMLNVFRDTTVVKQFTSKTSNRTVYYSNAQEPLRLKTQSCTYYNYAGDEWKQGDADRNFMTTLDSLPAKISGPGDLMNAYLKAAELDSGFAAKYGLAEYAGKKAKVPNEKKVTIYSIYGTSQYAPVPQFATEFDVDSFGSEPALTQSGLIYAGERLFSSRAKFTFSYSSERFMYYDDNKSVLDAMSRADYDDMSSEALGIITEKLLNDPDNSELLSYYSVLIGEEETMLAYEDELLDYGGNNRIKDLADQLTAGLDSDFDKAKIFERYFYNNNYIYDKEYSKKNTENAETFIFESKTGVCFEYATAMVLLSRAAGIPARFCIGYNMSEQSKNSDYTYEVTTNDAHAFPELYIKGYGWVSFEPTIADIVEQTEDRSAKDLLARAGMIILAASLLILAFVMLYPRISHRVFLITSKRKSPSQTAKAAMYRICRLYGIESGCTSQEAAELTVGMTDTDISKTAALFDKAVYGELELNEKEKEVIMEEYVKAYKSYMERKKLRRKPQNSM